MVEPDAQGPGLHGRNSTRKQGKGPRQAGDQASSAHAEWLRPGVPCLSPPSPPLSRLTRNGYSRGQCTGAGGVSVKEHRGGQAPGVVHSAGFRTTATQAAHTESLRPGLSCLYPHSPSVPAHADWLQPGRLSGGHQCGGAGLTCVRGHGGSGSQVRHTVWASTPPTPERRVRGHPPPPWPRGAWSWPAVASMQ